MKTQKLEHNNKSFENLKIIALSTPKSFVRGKRLNKCLVSERYSVNGLPENEKQEK